jgi:hypothetical protein
MLGLQIIQIVDPFQHVLHVKNVSHFNIILKKHGLNRGIAMVDMAATFHSSEKFIHFNE